MEIKFLCSERSSSLAAAWLRPPPPSPRWIHTGPKKKKIPVLPLDPTYDCSLTGKFPVLRLRRADIHCAVRRAGGPVLRLCRAETLQVIYAQ